MAWNCTLAVIINPPTHDLDADKAARRIALGDICDAYITETVADFLLPNWKMKGGIGSTRLAFVHVTDIPDVITFDKVKSVLIAPVYDPLSTVEDRRELRLNAWNIPVSIIPQAIKTKLLADKEVTLSFVNVKSYLRKKLVVSRLDPTQDDITYSVQDGDLI